MWAELFGIGIVDPVDDFRATNPPSNPALLDALTRRLVNDGFDAKAMIRFITASRTFGPLRTSKRKMALVRAKPVRDRLAAAHSHAHRTAAGRLRTEV